jgi:tRNA dimethylallyltransferase
MNKPKILVILGPTSTGKSALGVMIAKKFNGEIISADSRQIYTNLTIGSGKISEKEMSGVKHHLINIADENINFSVGDFKAQAEDVIKEIIVSEKTPIIVGGTGFYITSIVDGIALPEVPPNNKLRKELAETPAEILLEKLKILDPERTKTIEQKNPRRLIRAIEIAMAIGKVPPTELQEKYDSLQIGLDLPDNTLKSRIKMRTEKRLANGWAEEVQQLINAGVTKERFSEFGLGYAHIYSCLQEKHPINREEIEMKEWHYVKRQRTWFKRDTRIRWFNPENVEDITRLITDFLKND